MTTTIETAPSPERRVIALVATTLAALLAATFATALHVPSFVALVLALAAAAVATPALARRLPHEWDGAMRRHRAASVAWGVLALVAIARTAGVALFMSDPDQAQASAFWFDPFYIRHNCFSGYWQAAMLARDHVPNLYDPEHYWGFEDRFKLDEFLYLPQFVIAPLAGIVLGGGFLELRAAWFAIEGALLLATFVAIAVHVGGAVGRRLALLSLVVWFGSPVLLTLQLGNFQIAAIAMTLLALVLAERQRPIAAGALFGFALFKVFPGVLGIYLLVRRQWRAAIWTFAFAVLYTVIAYAWLGRAPFDAFVSFQLPRIANGDAWAFLEFDGMGPFIAINDSVPGLVLKLGMLGVDLGRGVENALSLAWTLFVVAMCVVAGLRAPRQTTLERVATWLALLTLASFRSPFLPDHNGLFGPLWLWAFVAAAAVPTARRVVLLAIGAIALSAVLPAFGMPFGLEPFGEMQKLAISTTSQFLAIALTLHVACRRPAADRPPRAVAADPNLILSVPRNSP